MEAGFDRERPIYVQIAERIKNRVLSGRYKPGEKLPSVRDLAMEMSVNPNTVQRAMAELEREGVLFSKRTVGRYISEDEELLGRFRQRMIAEEAEAFLNRLKDLGISREEIVLALEKAEEEIRDDTHCNV